MPSWKAWEQGPSDLIKGGGEAQALTSLLQKCSMKVENVPREQISIIYLNHYRIQYALIYS